MRNIKALSSFTCLTVIICLTPFFCNPVYGAEACTLFESALQATFDGSTVQLTGSGTVAERDIQKPYQIIVQMRGDQETRLRLSLDHEVISLILTDGNIYDDQMTEQKAGSLFAKLVSLGVLDPFFMLETISGKRTEMYSPYMTMASSAAPDSEHTLQLNLSPAESAILYKHWTADFYSFLGAAADGMSDRERSIAEGLLRQILTSLEMHVSYTYHIQPDTLVITQIDIQSEIAAPEIRSAWATIKLSAHNGD